MTWRAFIIGLIGVIALNLLTPVNDYALGNTFLTGNHFPVGVVSFLLVMTLVVNVAIKVVKARWAFRQAELMLIWCMMVVSATVPASGLMRYWFPAAAAGPYLAQRPDLFWEEDVLKAAPDGILLSRDPKSVAARKFYQGTPKDERIRVPWSHWTKVITHWGVYVVLYYLATLFACGILRKQWVESERLMFPLARLPMEFTEGSGGGGLLPGLVRQKAFLVGSGVTLAFGLVRLSPLFFGAEQGWCPRFPVNQVFAGTDWWRIQIADGWVFPIGIGFAYLVPADISLSMWFFYLFTCLEIQTAYYLGSPLESGPWGPFMHWQQAGAFAVLTVGLLWSARRHVWRVFLEAIGRSRSRTDAEEPIGYRLAFWGLLVSLAGMVAWNVYFRMSLWVSLMMVAMVLSIVIVHARLVTQGGLFFTQHSWNSVDLLHGISGGHAFSAAGAVVAQMQYTMFFHDPRELLSPHVMNALRIASVFKKRRRLLLPIILLTLAVAMVASGYSTLRWVYYGTGGLNLKDTYSALYCPTRMFERAHMMISNPTQTAQTHYFAVAIGAGIMLFLMIMRGMFYWWPIHALGWVVAESWCMRQLWFSFLVDWLVKASILKFGSGNTLRSARTFFLGVIMTEAAVAGICTLVSLFTGIHIGYIFLSS